MSDIYDPLERALSRGSLAQQMALEPSYTMTADQEIRARALECSVRWLSSRTDALEAVGVTDEEIKALFWGFAKDFETYIKTGEKG